MIDWNTSNLSFIKVHHQLKALGIKNNAFFLTLLDPTLQGVDPFADDTINNIELVARIQIECKLNPWYYLREVVRIPEEAGDVVRFRLDRGTLASSWCIVNSINHYLMKPRQTGKSVGIDAVLSWVFKVRTTNSSFMFIANSEEIAKKNLGTMVKQISRLPPYLAKVGVVAYDNTGKKKRRTDNIKKYSEPVTDNVAIVGKSPSTEASAEQVGRGLSQIFQFFDEAEFTNYISTVVKVSGMSFNTASTTAAKNGGIHCRIFATTPGDLSQACCQSAFELVDNAVPWTETFYDMDINEVKYIINNQSNFQLTYIEYNYQQLGLSEEWFLKACRNVGFDPVKIQREILLQRFSSSTDSPFDKMDLMEIGENKKEPIKVFKIGALYELLFYKKPLKNRPYIISIDPSDGTGGDSYAMVAVDPYTLETIMEFKNAHIDESMIIDILGLLVTKFMNKPIIVVESNKGIPLIKLIDKVPLLKHRLYYGKSANIDKEVLREKLDEKGFIEQQMASYRYYGVHTTGSSRPIMMSILVDYVKFKKEHIRTKYLIEDIDGLVLKSGKIQAGSGQHDDIVMAWCIAMYTRFYGEDLARYGFNPDLAHLDEMQSDPEYEKLRKLYKDPEIQKAFPSMYELFKQTASIKEAERRLQLEDLKEESIRNPSGGIDDPDIIHARAMVRQGGQPSALSSKFSSLNKGNVITNQTSW